MDRGYYFSEKTCRVTLSQYQIELALFAARQRSFMNAENGARPRYGAPTGAEGERINNDGAIAEFAVAKFLNLFWCGSVGNYHALDVGGLVEVRAADLPSKRLLLHKPDRDEAPFVSAIVEKNNSEIVLRGWLFGHEAKDEQYWSDPSKKNRPAYFVKTSVLRDMNSLVDYVSGRA